MVYGDTGSKRLSPYEYCSVIDWLPVNKRTDSWLDGRENVRFGLLLVYALVKIHCNSDYRKRWRDVIDQHPDHSHGYKSVADM